MRKTLTISNNRSASDRFIPRRDDTEFAYHLIESNNYNSTTNSNPETAVNFPENGIVNTAKQLYFRNNYRATLRAMLLPQKNKVLQFSSPRKEHMKKIDVEKNTWPVEARSKPLLASPSIVLDMPDLSVALNRQVIDWGQTGYMATAYCGEVHLWNPNKTKRFVTETNGRVKHCVKWNYAGTAFAMSLRQSSIAIWNFQQEKVVTEIKCTCNSGCLITAMAWTRTQNLITGCSNGRIGWYSSEFKKTHNGNFFSNSIVHGGDIINLKLSPGELYLVSTGKDQKVKIWFIPNPEINYEIIFDIPVKGVAFHPWRDSLLAVGTPEYIGIWNVNTMKEIDRRRHSGNYVVEYVDCLTFNPVSGELLVSCWCSNNTEMFTCLKVLKNLDTVVDEVQFKYGRIPYLLWDSTGTQLATAASDESLNIWNFFGISTKFMHKQLNKKKKLTTNMFETLNMFGNTIR